MRTPDIRAIRTTEHRADINTKIIPNDPHFPGFNRHARATERKDPVGNNIHNTVEPTPQKSFFEFTFSRHKTGSGPGRLKKVQSRENFSINCRLIYVRTANTITHTGPRSERYAGKGSPLKSPGQGTG